jgi:hypothetical protein
MRIKFASAAAAAGLLTTTAVASAEWRISIPNGPTPFLTVVSTDDTADRLAEYYGGYARAAGYYFVRRNREDRYWRHY